MCPCPLTSRPSPEWSRRSTPAVAGRSSGHAAGMVSRHYLPRLWLNPGLPAQNALIPGPTETPGFLIALCQGLGRQVAPAAQLSRGLAWRALEDTVKLFRWQRQGLVFGIDDCQNLVDPVSRLDLERLAYLDPHPDTRLTIVMSVREEDSADPEERYAESGPGPGPCPDPGDLLIRLPALTRSETELYVTAKLAAAGRDVPTFTPRDPVSPHRDHRESSDHRPDRLAGADGRRLRGSRSSPPT